MGKQVIFELSFGSTGYTSGTFYFTSLEELHQAVAGFFEKQVGANYEKLGDNYAHVLRPATISYRVSMIEVITEEEFDKAVAELCKNTSDAEE